MSSSGSGKGGGSDGKTPSTGSNDTPGKDGNPKSTKKVDDKSKSKDVTTKQDVSNNESNKSNKTPSTGSNGTSDGGSKSPSTKTPSKPNVGNVTKKTSIDGKPPTSPFKYASNVNLVHGKTLMCDMFERTFWMKEGKLGDKDGQRIPVYPVVRNKMAEFHPMDEFKKSSSGKHYEVICKTLTTVGNTSSVGKDGKDTKSKDDGKDGKDDGKTTKDDGKDKAKSESKVDTKTEGQTSNGAGTFKFDFPTNGFILEIYHQSSYDADPNSKKATPRGVDYEGIICDLLNGKFYQENQAQELTRVHPYVRYPEQVMIFRPQPLLVRLQDGSTAPLHESLGKAILAKDDQGNETWHYYYPAPQPIKYKIDPWSPSQLLEKGPSSEWATMVDDKSNGSKSAGSPGSEQSGKEYEERKVGDPNAIHPMFNMPIVTQDGVPFEAGTTAVPQTAPATEPPLPPPAVVEPPPKKDEVPLSENGTKGTPSDGGKSDGKPGEGGKEGSPKSDGTSSGPLEKPPTEPSLADNKSSGPSDGATEPRPGAFTGPNDLEPKPSDKGKSGQPGGTGSSGTPSAGSSPPPKDKIAEQVKSPSSASPSASPSVISSDSMPTPTSKGSEGTPAGGSSGGSPGSAGSGGSPTGTTGATSAPSNISAKGSEPSSVGTTGAPGGAGGQGASGKPVLIVRQPATTAPSSSSSAGGAGGAGGRGGDADDTLVIGEPMTWGDDYVLSDDEDFDTSPGPSSPSSSGSSKSPDGASSGSIASSGTNATTTSGPSGERKNPFEKSGRGHPNYEHNEMTTIHHPKTPPSTWKKGGPPIGGGGQKKDNVASQVPKAAKDTETSSSGSSDGSYKTAGETPSQIPAPPRDYWKSSLEHPKTPPSTWKGAKEEKVSKESPKEKQVKKGSSFGVIKMKKKD